MAGVTLSAAMELQDVERELASIALERQRLDEMEKAYRMILHLMGTRRTPGPAQLSNVEVVRESVERMTGPFPVRDIHTDIRLGFRDDIPRPHISAILSEMARERFVRVVAKGAGRRGSVYEKNYP